jgi:hypothetical protein
LRGLKSDHVLPFISLSPDFEGETMSNSYGRPLYAHRVPQGGDASDFCNTSPAFKGYQCENFEFSGLPLFRSGSGMWAACRKCSELVDAEKWSSLADRAVRKFVKRNAVPRQEVPQLWVQFTEIVRLFAEHRKRLA